MKHTLHLLGCLLMWAMCLSTTHAAETREKFNFNADWLLQVGDDPQAKELRYDDSAWRRVTLPRPFNEDEAFRLDIHDLTDTIVWYRKRFRLPKGSRGKKVFVEGTTRLQQSDAERHRLTAGLTFHVANKYFPTDIRLNYEKYWYPHGCTPKESEQDKLVAELMIRF